MVAFGLSNKCTQALITSLRLCGGMSVAMPTAIPVLPLSNIVGLGRQQLGFLNAAITRWFDGAVQFR